MAEQFIELSLIADNPYQPRTTDDPEHIEKLARSIAADGLLQLPKARQNGSVELAFGHSRRKAFEWLQANWSAQELLDRYSGYSCMPVEIVELSDEEMYRHAVAENVQRKDLNDIELAKAMAVYRDQFKKSSDEIGLLFGVTGSTVRGTIRLLDLPADVQEKVASKEITQGNARRLLTLQRVAPEQVSHVAKELKKDVDPDILISTALTNSGKTVEMWPSWRGANEPKAGEHLWSLRTPADAFPKEHLPDLKVGAVGQLLDIKLDGEMRHKVQVYLEAISQNPETALSLLDSQKEDALLIERIAHLLNPPACTACPLYAKIGGSHYCTFRACFNRKAQAWTKNEAEQATQQLGIALYDHKVDGAFVQMDSYVDKHRKLVESRGADLRLKKGSNWNNFSGVPHGYVIVAVGTTAEKLTAAKAKEEASRSSREDRDASERAWKRKQRIREANSVAMNEFLWNVATPAFQSLLEEVTSIGFLCDFADKTVTGVPAEEPDPKTKKSDRLAFYRRALLFNLLDDVCDTWDISQKPSPVAALAEQLRDIAGRWGVKLPKNFLELAREADKAINYDDVSVETDGDNE